jgi:hypothetical protein
MKTYKFSVLKGITTINGNKYPMYTGFLNAKILTEIAEVPSFSREKTHQAIAADAIKTPLGEWQRPEDPEKILKIKAIYGDSQKDNLMANPVLLGTALQNISPPDVSITVNQKTITTSLGEVIPIDENYEITVKYDENKRKPLWILDGQHRIKGLAISSQKLEVIPFVFLHDPKKYDSPFLAEIFTHVTTGADPMKEIHGDWMKFAFSLPRYNTYESQQAMHTTVILCKEPKIAGFINPFNNKIQFNPYQTTPSWNSFSFNSMGWVELLLDNYFGKGGKFTAIELAEEIIKATLSFEKLDSKKDISSKLFSSINPHKIFSEAYLIGLLTYLSSLTKGKTPSEWDSFFLEPMRAVNTCDFELTFVVSPGAMSSANGNPSKKIATDCFINFFCQPGNLNGNKLSDFLQGIGGVFRISAYKLVGNKIDKKSKIHLDIPYGSGLIPFNISAGGIRREIIKIESLTSNIICDNVSEAMVTPVQKINGALKNGGNIDYFPNTKQIEVEYMAYSGDTRQSTKIRIDRI